MILNDVQELDSVSKVMKKIMPSSSKNVTHFFQFAWIQTRSQNYEKNAEILNSKKSISGALDHQGTEPALIHKHCHLYIFGLVLQPSHLNPS